MTGSVGRRNSSLEADEEEQGDKPWDMVEMLMLVDEQKEVIVCFFF